MKRIAIFTLSLALSFQTFAKDWEQTVIIDGATCFYDEYGFPKIEIIISPSVTVEEKTISKFINARTPEMCPNLNEISDRLYVSVIFRIEEDSFSYALDENGICNRYKTMTLSMSIPIHRSRNRSHLAMVATIERNLEERNLSIGHCTGGH
jgi:hypothetical protein